MNRKALGVETRPDVQELFLLGGQVLTRDVSKNNISSQ
jgi:hypothetical protein